MSLLHRQTRDGDAARGAMTLTVPLRPGPVVAEGFEIQRSGFRWLCDDGHLCQAGEVIAWCAIGLAPKPGRAPRASPFRDETHDLQLALATPVGGRLTKAVASSRGGFLDLLQHFRHWDADSPIGTLECDPGDLPPGAEPRDAGTLRALMLAGRRVTEQAEVRSGLLTGWHDRARGWWDDGHGDGPGARWGTLLGLGICEQLGIVRGERGAFLELFASAPGPAHVVFVPDDALVPSAAVLASQLRRTEADRRAIAEDMAATLPPLLASHAGPGAAGAADWIFAGSLLKALLRSPLEERYDLLTRTGLTAVGPADAVLLSLNSEPPEVLRHRRLGYVVACHGFRVAQAGAALTAWLRARFEVVRRATDDLRRDYRELIDLIRDRTGAHVLILNGSSSVGLEGVYCYAPFGPSPGETLASVRAKELNLMLLDLARERDVSIIDVDAIAADLGAGRHLPDGVHQSGRFQAEARALVLDALRERGVPGFGPPPGSGDLELDRHGRQVGGEAR